MSDAGCLLQGCGGRGGRGGRRQGLHHGAGAGARARRRAWPAAEAGPYVPTLAAISHASGDRSEKQYDVQPVTV